MYLYLSCAMCVCVFNVFVLVMCSLCICTRNVFLSINMSSCGDCVVCKVCVCDDVSVYQCVCVTRGV